MAAIPRKSLLGRYQLLDHLLQRLAAARATIEETVTARSPLQRHPDAEQNLRNRWEDELKAAIEAEYRLERQNLLGLVQWWLRDVWLAKIRMDATTARSEEETTLLRFPEIPGTPVVAGRITPVEALSNLRVMEDLQRWLHTNVQEALALEVGLLKLHL